MPVAEQRRIIPYSEARPLLQVADVGLCRGDAWYQRVVGIASGSQYVHVGMLDRWHNRWHFLQSTAFADRKPLLSAEVCRRPGMIDVYRYRDGLLPEVAEAITSDMIGVVGNRYGWLSFACVAAHHTPFVRRYVLPDENDLTETKLRPICSEAVAKCYRYHGIDLVLNLADRSTEPVSIARGGVVVYQFTIGSIDTDYPPPAEILKLV